MTTIESKIQEYNTTANELFDGADYALLATIEPATDADLQQLKHLMNFELPDELIQFYKTFGGLENIGNSESYCFSISEPEKLIKINDYQGSPKIALGLIEMIQYSWSFDRWEFDEGENFTAEEINQLNANYKCIGWYRDDTISETAYYIFFDQHGNFGELYYDQDTFYKTFEALKKLLANDFEKTTLESLLVKALEQTKKTMIEWNE
jgi:SMI1 / KNR4 family (SUKH-1)